MKSLNILGISWNPLTKPGFHEITEMFRDFMKSLVSQSYCNIYIGWVKKNIFFLKYRTDVPPPLQFLGMKKK